MFQRKPPAAFRQGNDNVPIVGQPFEVKGWHTNIMVVCNCEAKEPVLICGTAIGKCGKCGRGFKLQVLNWDLNTGKTTISIGVIVTPQQATEMAASGGKPS